MLRDFKAFVMRGNVLDLAVGVIIGAAFGSIVNSLVNDVLMPPLGLILGNVDFSNLFFVLKDGAQHAGPYATIAEAKAAGAVSLGYGLFINAIVSFLIVAFSIFLVIRAVARLQREEKAAPPAPAAPSNQEILLGEIRDILKKRG